MARWLPLVAEKGSHGPSEQPGVLASLSRRRFKGSNPLRSTVSRISGSRPGPGGQHQPLCCPQQGLRWEVAGTSDMGPYYQDR